MPRLLLVAVVASCGAFAPRARPLRAGMSVRGEPGSSGGMLPSTAQELMGLLGSAKDREKISFQLTMDVIEEMYDYADVAFSVGSVASAPGENTGSAKIFSFAKISGLEAKTTLSLFGDYYRKDVLGNPDGKDHANIRAFMQGGWDAVKFPDGLALARKDLQNSYEAFGPAMGSEYQTY